MLEPTAVGDAWDAIFAIVRDLSVTFETGASTAARVGASNRSTRRFSLAGGDAGIATFLHEVSLAERGDCEGAASLRDAYLGRAVAALSEEAMNASFYSGFSGIAWAVDRMSKAPGEPLSLEPDALDSIDRVLLDYVARRPDGELDVVSGVIGVGVYLLERLPRETAHRGLSIIIDTLAERAERHGAQVAWLTPPSLLDADDRAKYPEGRYDLGVAHGVPGIVAFLARCIEASVSIETARELLEGAVSWLVDCCELRLGAPRFPYWIAPVGPTQPTRLAWCYGDLGVSLALRSAAVATSRVDFWNFAVKLAEDAARRPVESAGIIDGGLCHGTAGAAHLFRHWFRATGQQSFLDASRFWFRETLALRNEGSGVGGYRSVIRDVELRDVWIDNPELLNGAAGIGLALLAAVTDRAPTWDRFLLLSPSGETSERGVR